MTILNLVMEHKLKYKHSYLIIFTVPTCNICNCI